MMMKATILCVLFQSAHGLLTKPFSLRSRESWSHLNMDRRSVIAATTAVFGVLDFSMLLPIANGASEKGKIVVLGGSGYVGAHVDAFLSESGYDVVSVSRSTSAQQASKIEAILGRKLPIQYESLDASTADLSAVLTGANAVVSCIGVAPGGKNQRDGNGAVNVRVAEQAKAAGIDRFVYVSVASELANSPAKFLLGDYFQGKATAEAAVRETYGPNRSLFVKPAIIEGGPPGERRPPGPPGFTPVPVEAVARVVAAGAVGVLNGVVDGNNAIAVWE